MRVAMRALPIRRLIVMSGLFRFGRQGATVVVSVFACPSPVTGANVPTKSPCAVVPGSGGRSGTDRRPYAPPRGGSPTKLSQVLEMGELRWKLAALAAGDEWALAGGTMPSSALDGLATACERRPKRGALEHNSHADKQGRNTPLSHFHGSVWWGPRPVRLADPQFIIGGMQLGQFTQDGEHPLGHAPNGTERAAGFLSSRRESSLWAHLGNSAGRGPYPLVMC
jgi:hypothetical protein